MTKFLAELKRRHVYRVAAAYAVVAWVLLQLVSNVAPILDLPPWIARAVLMFLVLGFPISLLLAWMFDSPHIPRYFLMLVAMLAIPLARVSAAPLALAWNRHR